MAAWGDHGWAPPVKSNENLKIFSFISGMALLPTWNDYFKAKRRLKWTQRLFGGMPAAVSFLAADLALLSLPVFNPTLSIAGLDPVVVIACGTALGTGASFVMGSFLFTSLYRRFNPKLHREYDARDADYHQRVQRHKANVPPGPTELASHDFYGERVHSVQGYRAWLKKQMKLKASRIFKAKK